VDIYEIVLLFLGSCVGSIGAAWLLASAGNLAFFVSALAGIVSPIIVTGIWSRMRESA